MEESATARYVNSRAFMLIAACSLGVACIIGLTATETAFAAAKPSKVSLTSAALISKNNVRITWKKVSHAKKYEVYQKAGGGSFKRARTTTRKSASFKIASGTTVKYKVRAVNGSKKGSFSAAKTVKSIASNAVKPVVASKTATSITLKWTKIRNASGYKIYKSDGSDYTYSGVASGTAFKVTGLDLGTSYTLKVMPYIISGKKSFSGTSGTVRATTNQAAFFMDLVKPYQTSGWWGDYTSGSFTMNGVNYSHGFIGRGVKEGGTTLWFNLQGKYSTMTFDAGFVSANWNSPKDGGVLLYGDGELIKDVQIPCESLPESYSVDVTGVSIIKVVFYSDTWSLDVSEKYGLANIQVKK